MSLTTYHEKRTINIQEWEDKKIALQKIEIEQNDLLALEYLTYKILPSFITELGFEESNFNFPILLNFHSNPLSNYLQETYNHYYHKADLDLQIYIVFCELSHCSGIGISYKDYLAEILFDKTLYKPADVVVRYYRKVEPYGETDVAIHKIESGNFDLVGLSEKILNTIRIVYQQQKIFNAYPEGETI